MLRYFKGTCEAIRAMHAYRAPMGSKTDAFASRANPSRHAPSAPSSPRNSLSGDEDDQMFPQPEGDGDGGYSYHGAGGSGSKVPLISKDRPQGIGEEHEPIFDGDEELERIQHEGGNGHAGETELVPYAHRDLKPGYVPIVHPAAPQSLSTTASLMQERHDLG